MLMNISRWFQWRRWCRKYGFRPEIRPFGPIFPSYVICRRGDMEVCLRVDIDGEYRAVVFDWHGKQTHDYQFPRSEAEFIAMII